MTLHTPSDPRRRAPLLRWEIVVGMAIVLIFVALNIHDAAHLHLWYDEGWTLAEITGVLGGQGVHIPPGVHPGDTFQTLVAQPGPFEEVAASLYAHDVHPPLYFQALWGWAHLFGTSPLALRALSITSMLGAALLVFAYARRDTGPAALMALVLMLASPGAAYAAVNARGYGLGLLITTIALLAMLQALRSPHAWRWALLSGAATGAAVMTHYFSLLVLIPSCLVALAFLIAQREGRAILAALLGAAPGLVSVTLVWLPQHLDARPAQMSGFVNWPVEVFSLFRVVVNQFTRYTLDHLGIAIAVTAITALLLAALIQQARQGWRDPDIAIPAAGFLGSIGLLILLFWTTDKTLMSFSVPRYGVFALPCLALLLARMPAEQWTERRRFLLPAIAFIAAVGLWPRTDPATFDQPWANHQAALQAQILLEKEPNPADSLVIITGEEPGMIGILLGGIPADQPTVHAPTPEDFRAVLATQPPARLHMRPVPWASEPGKTPFPPGYHRAAQEAGYIEGPGLTWVRLPISGPLLLPIAPAPAPQ